MTTTNQQPGSLWAELQRLDREAEQECAKQRKHWHQALQLLLSRGPSALTPDEEALLTAVYLELQPSGSVDADFQKALDAVAKAGHEVVAAGSGDSRRRAWLLIALMGLAARLDD